MIRKVEQAFFYPLDRNDLSNGLSSGDVICWEPHFGANDFGITKDKLVENPQLEVIKIFVPDEKVYALNNYPYEVIIVRVK